MVRIVRRTVHTRLVLAPAMRVELRIEHTVRVAIAIVAAPRAMQRVFHRHWLQQVRVALWRSLDGFQGLTVLRVVCVVQNNPHHTRYPENRLVLQQGVKQLAVRVLRGTKQIEMLIDGKVIFKKVIQHAVC